MKRKAWKRWLGVILAAGILAGCGGASDETASSAGTQAASAAEAGEEQASGEKMVIRISAWDLQEQFEAENAENDTIYNEMSDKLGIEIDPISVQEATGRRKPMCGRLPDSFRTCFTHRYQRITRLSTAAGQDRVSSRRCRMI